MKQWKVGLLVLILVQCVKENSSVFWPCELDDECTAVGSRCDIALSSCTCNDFDYVFSEDFRKCLQTSLIGDSCDETVQCNLMPSGANCKSGVCDCADGHTYVRGRCQPLNGLDQSCESDSDCYFGYDRESVKCENRVCQCANGYYHRHGNICRRKSMGIGDACVVNADCADLGSDIICKDLKCFKDTPTTTEAATTTTTTGTTIETTEGTETSEITETSEVTEATDTTVNPNESTLTTSITTETLSTEAGSSVTSTPTTETSFAENGSLAGLRKSQTSNSLKSEKSNDQVVLLNGGQSDSSPSSDDEEEDTDILSEIEVLTHNEPQPYARLNSREIAVQTSLDAFELKDLTRKFRNVGTATTSTSTSSRRTYKNKRRQRSYRDEFKTLSTYSNTDDEAETSKYGSSCTELGKQCPGLRHSLCSQNMCFCKRGYYPKNGKCFAELGEIAETEDDCEFEYQPETRKCLCQQNYFFERNLRSCRKPIQYHLSCTSNSQCSPFGAAFCHPQIPRRCNCEQFAEYDAYQQMCIFKQGLGSECERNEGCPVKNSVCLNKTCVCAENYLEKDGACVPGIGGECEETAQCSVKNSECEVKLQMEEEEEEVEEPEEREKTCQCKKGYVHFKDECLKEAEEIEDECVDNEQCKPLLASCDNQKCKCKDDQQFKNGKCQPKRELGALCTKATECYVEKDPETVECRNSVCQCKFGYQADGSQRHCIRIIPNKKNSSGRPSALKIVTFMLIGAAFFVTSAAIKQAYFF